MKKNPLSEAIEKEVKADIKKIAVAVCEDTLQEKSLVSPDARIASMENEMLTKFNHTSKECQEGLQHIIVSLQEMSAHDPSINLNEVTASFNQIASKFANVDDVKAYGEAFAEGKTLCEFLQIKDSVIDLLYTSARHLLESNKYHEAHQAFTFLVMLNAEQYEFWVGLGHSAFFLHHFEQALNAYGMAEVCNPNSCWPIIWAANCYEEQKDWVHAHHYLEIALEALKDSDDENKNGVEESLKERITRLNNLKQR